MDVVVGVVKQEQSQARIGRFEGRWDIELFGKCIKLVTW